MNDEDDNIAMYYDTYIVSYLPTVVFPVSSLLVHASPEPTETRVGMLG